MLRLFETHYMRDYHLLEGLWDFSVPDNAKTYKMSVPGCWENTPEFATYRGTATYTKEINVKEDCNLRLVFKGVSHTADVYFDDEFVVHHYNAYTPFDGIVKNVKKGTHTVRVEVDNSFSEASALHIPNDYYTYGRLIGAEVLDPATIVTSALSADAATIKVFVWDTTVNPLAKAYVK